MSARKLQPGDVLLAYADEDEVIHDQVVAAAGDPARAKLIVSLVADVTRALSEQATDTITIGEAEVLAEYPSATEAEFADAVAGAVLARHRLLAGSLTTRQAADVVGVNPSRIRQRLDDRSLWGYKHEGEWRVPAWQLRSGGLVEGIATVNQALDEDLDPLEVEGFYHTPSPDLRLAGTNATPLQWLEAGLDPAPVTRIAASL